MSFKQNNPISRKTSPINRDWIKGAIKRPGAFRKKAEEAGMSTKAFADKVTANKEDYSARTGRQAELAETLMGMSRHKSGHKNPEQGDFDYEDPNYRDTPEYKKFQRKQKRKNKKNKPKRGEAGFEQDEQEAYYEGKSDKIDKKKGVSRRSSDERVNEVRELSVNKAMKGRRTMKNRNLKPAGKVSVESAKVDLKETMKPMVEKAKPVSVPKSKQKKTPKESVETRARKSVKAPSKEKAGKMSISRKNCKYKK